MNQAIRRPNQSHWTIILAAGASRRLTRPKQLLRKRSRTLISRAVALANRFTPNRTVVVVGADHLRIRAHLRRSTHTAHIVYNRRWRNGMGTSLACALKALPAGTRSVLVMLTDQPNIDTATLQRLLIAHRRNAAASIACAYAGRVGVPAIFPDSSFKTLSKLDGDRGARDVLQTASKLVVVNCPEAAVDIDTFADFVHLR